MKNAYSSLRYFLRVALLLLLLTAQSLAYAHELAHLNGSELGICATCSISNGLSATVAISHDIPVAQNYHCSYLAGPVHFTEFPSLATFFARAPPLSC